MQPSVTPSPVPPSDLRPLRPTQRLSPVQALHRAAVFAKLATGEYRFETVPICLCGASGGVLVAGQDRFGIPIGVIACSACGLLRTSPRLSAENLPAFYESHYHGLHFGIEQPTGETALVRIGQGSAIWDFCADLLRSRSADRPLEVVDIGAGTGAVLREFTAAAAAEGREVDSVGCEYSSTFAAVARERGTAVRSGGIETLLNTGLSPDLVIMSHVVEHFPDPLADLQFVRGLVLPETILYVEVPGLLTIESKPRYDYRLDTYLTLAHTYHFTLGTLVDTMERAGFRLLRGDEQVRAVFRLATGESFGARATNGLLPEPPGMRLAHLLAYLNRLERSPRIRLRRAVVGRLLAIRRAGVRGLRRIIGEGGVAALKRTLRR